MSLTAPWESFRQRLVPRVVWGWRRTDNGGDGRRSRPLRDGSPGRRGLAALRGLRGKGPQGRARRRRSNSKLLKVRVAVADVHGVARDGSDQHAVTTELGAAGRRVGATGAQLIALGSVKVSVPHGSVVERGARLL
jgi:hypothetical protein